MQKIRKVFVISVMLMTVFSMSVVVAPGASAAASAGDLIKMDGRNTVYYLGADNKRYVFSSANVYFSWYGDFSSVKTIPQLELESYGLAGKNVTVRPGTKLVKITTNPLVYAVDPNGVLRSIVSEANATNLWGSNVWTTKIIDIADESFADYTVGAPLTVGVYPTGTLVKAATSPDVYYFDGTNYRKFGSELAFTGNRFSFDNVVTAPSTITIAAGGTAIAAAETALIDTSSGAGGTVPLGGSGLIVALAGDTPIGQSLPSGATLVDFLKINLTASSDGAVTVNNLVLTRTGTGATTDIDGGYLYDGDNRLTTIRSINSTDHTISFNALGVKVNAGATKQLTLKINGTAGDKTGSHAFKLVSASNVTTDGATVSGTFPITGNTFAFSAVDAATVTLTSTDDLPNVKIGETAVKVLDFNIANDSQEVVKINRIKLKNDGTSGNDSVKNLSLEIDGTVVATGVNMSDRYADFMLATPFELIKGKTVTATVRGDVINDITKTFQLYLNNIADIDARGTAYGSFYSATITNTSLDSGTDSTSADDILISGSEINVSFDGPAAGDIKADTDDVILANFKINTVNDVNIETMDVDLTVTGTGSNGSLDNVEMVDSANGLAFTVADPASSTGATAMAFENILLEGGKSYNFQIRGDVPALTGAGTTFVASIDFSASFTAKFQDSNETAVVIGDMSQTSLTGKTMTVAAPSVSLTKVTTSAATYVKNASKVLLFKGRIAAGAVSKLTASKLTFGTTFGTIDSIDDAFSKLYLCNASDILCATPLDTETSLTGATSVAFSGFSKEIPANISNAVDVIILGDVKDSPTAGSMALHWGTGSATTTAFSIKDSDSTALEASQYTASMTDGQTTTISTAGTFTMTVDTDLAGLNANKNVLAGSNVLVGRIKLTATNEDARLEDFTLYNLRGTATADDIAGLSIYDNASLTGTALGTMALDSSRRALFSDININIPKTGVKYIYVGAALNAIDYSVSPASGSTAAAERTIRLDIASTTGYIVKAVGTNTSTVLGVNGVASTTPTNISTVLGATMSGITSDFLAAGSATAGSGVLNNGTAKNVFSFKVTAPASGNFDNDGIALAVKLATTTFTVASTTDVTFATFLVERVGGANGEVAAKYAGTTATAIGANSTFVINFSDTYGTNSDLKIKPGETAEYIIKATITGVGASESAQTTIEGLTTNSSYTHNTGAAGVDAADIVAVYPLLSGVTSVRAGTLSN
jgi:hypothetical protein